MEYSCPLCGAKTDWDLDCPGYPGMWNGKKTIMVCQPYCGNAFRFFCTNRECLWWHRSPNRRDAAGMGIAPIWLEQALTQLEPGEDERV